jgi:hypothetical protein
MRKDIAEPISRMPGSATCSHLFCCRLAFFVQVLTSRACERASVDSTGTSLTFRKHADCLSARMQKGQLVPISCGFARLHARELQTGAENPIRQARSAPRRPRVLVLTPKDLSQRWHSPAKSHAATPSVAMAAVGKLAVEAGEQRRVLIEREPRAGIDLQRVAPGARAVDRE